MGTHPIFESDFDCLTEREKMTDEDEREALNQKIINIGGTALLGTSFITAGTVGIGRAAVAKRAAKGEFGKDVNPKMMNEGSELAMKAFGRATMYTFGIFGASIGSWCWYNNVWSLKDLRTHLKSYHSCHISPGDSKPTTWEDIIGETDEKKT